MATAYLPSNMYYIVAGSNNAFPVRSDIRVLRLNYASSSCTELSTINVTNVTLTTGNVWYLLLLALSLLRYCYHC